MNQRQEDVLREVQDSGTRLVRLWFTDVSGKLKGIAIDSSQLEEAFTLGVPFDGSAVEGLSRIYESDMVLVPDASTYCQLPWHHETGPVGRMFCDIYTPTGQQSRSDPRFVLERVLERAEAQGLTVQVQPEIEFYLLEQPGVPGHLTPVDQASYFDHVAWGDTNEFRRKVVAALEEVGIAVEYSHHEGGPGQNEIDLRAAGALETADNIMTARAVIAEVALREQMIATFMPKPFIEHPGSGLHLHLSLFEGSQNVFFSGGGRYNLSNTARHFIAGLLAEARAMSGVISQHVNSYKRLWGGGEAPSYICWGHNNRSALVRIPFWNPLRPEESSIEFRAADSSTNPYLGLALLISAGLKGVEERLPLEEETEDDVWTLSDQERRALGIPSLPISLSQALDALEESEAVAEVLGANVHDYVLRNGKNEWQEYRAQITAREYEPFFGRQ